MMRWRQVQRVNGEVLENTKIRCFNEEYGIMVNINRITRSNAVVVYIEADGDAPLTEGSDQETLETVALLLSTLLTGVRDELARLPNKKTVPPTTPPDGVLLQD